MSFRLKFLFILLLASVTTGHAQRSPAPLDPSKSLRHYKLNVWTNRSGLPQNSVRSIAQATDGYLWLATEAGLVKFDGVKFDVFNDLNTAAMRSAWVMSVVADTGGGVWAATNGGGLLHVRGGRFERYDETTGLTSNFITALFRTRSGALWVGTEGDGINVIDGGKLRRYGTDAGLPHSRISEIVQDQGGTVWVATHTGLYRMQGRRFVQHAIPGMKNPMIGALTLTRDGTLWIGTARALVRYHPGAKTFNRVQGLSSEYILDIAQDSAGTVWVGTNGGGLNRLRNGDVDVLDSRAGLPSDLVLVSTQDREGNLWVGTNGGGLVRLSDVSFATYGVPEGLSHDIALALLEDRAGNMWIGTAGGGLNRLSGRDRTVYRKADGLASDIIVALEEDARGAVWIGTPQGLSRISNGMITTFGTADGLANNQVNAILNDSRGHLWLGTWGGGLQRWRPGRPVVLGKDAGLAGNFVTALIEDGRGQIWIGTRDGLSRIAGGVTTTFTKADGLTGNYVTALYDDQRGGIWIGTEADGISYFRGGAFLTLARREGLIGNTIHAIIADSSGNLWVTSNEGVFRIPRQDVDAFTSRRKSRVSGSLFGVDHGMRSNEANGGVQPSAWRRRDGSLWFPTIAGAVRVDPRAIEHATPLPAVIIEQAVVGDSAILEPVRRLNVPAGRRDLAIHFTVPTFSTPEETSFAYKLTGFDEHWQIAGSRRSAYYTNLPPGQYRFRVIASNAHGEWNAEGPGLEIHVAAFYYEKWWVRLLAGVALATGFIWVIARRMQLLRARARTLADLLADKTRAEGAALHAQEQLSLALDAGNMGTWDWTLDSDTTGLNESPENPNLGSGQLSGAAQAFLGSVHPDDRQRIEKSLEDALRSRQSKVQLEYRTVSDSQVRWIERRGELIFNEGGLPQRVLGVAIDTTEQHARADALREREEQLRQSQKMEAVGQLAGGIAHDFNNLLTAIVGHTQLLIDSLPQDDERYGDAITVLQAADRAAGLTRQLLTFSRKNVVQPRVLSLRSVTQDALRMLSRLVGEHVRLIPRLAPDTGNILADPGSIDQVIMNLVLNARDALPAGGEITVETCNIAVQTADQRAALKAIPQGDYVLLAVHDNGMGMDKQTQERIFEPFFTTKEPGNGTGLGLSTVYGIVEQNLAHMTVDSTVGIGTRFSIYFPLIAEAADVTLPTSEGPSADSLQGTVLLVEDDNAVRMLAAKVLRKTGLRVLEAGNAAEGLAIANETPALSLLISDIGLPDMNGSDLCTAIRAILPQLPVVFMSGYDADEIARRVRHENIAIIEKPVSPAALVDQVRQALAPRPGVE